MVRTRASLSREANNLLHHHTGSSRREITSSRSDNQDKNKEHPSLKNNSNNNKSGDVHNNDDRQTTTSSNVNGRNSGISNEHTIKSENNNFLDESESTKPVPKRVSFSSNVTDDEEKDSPNSALRKRKQRDIAKLIISPAEPIGHIIVYSNVKQSVRPDSMTLWTDPMGSKEDALTAIKFGADPVTNNVQIKRAVNKKWPILQDHCTLTHDGNSTVLLLEKEAMVLVNGQFYKNSQTAEKNVICVDRVIIDYGDIIELDGRLFIFAKHNLPSYFANYQQMFVDYLENNNKKRKREDEANESCVKKEKLSQTSEEDENTEEEQNLNEDEHIDSEELHNAISEMGEEEIEDYDGHLNELSLGSDDMNLQPEEADNNIPSFFSENNNGTPDQTDPTATQSQEDGDLENIIGAELYQEIIEKLNTEVSKQIEEKEKEFAKKVEALEKSLREEKERTSQHLYLLEKQIESLKNTLKDKEEEIEEHKRALEKSKQQIEKNESQRKDYEKLKFKTTDLEKKLQEKINAQDTLLNENKLLRQQIVNLKKNSQQNETFKNVLDKKEKELEKIRARIRSFDNFIQSTTEEMQAQSKGLIRAFNQDPIEDDSIIFSVDEIESSQNVSNQATIKNQAIHKRPLQFGKSEPGSSKPLLPINSTKKFNSTETLNSRNDNDEIQNNDHSEEDFEI
ncbi:hypothetical protein FDP41_001638 [Naegleria fowleri]|uniref:FHA domain-containing protein n=1 Tax=Naegleria fowleri TaxID=5763 RepID=A0A6A5C184_NAEFO|nr:uncharacterized protein FDP41_001638 [Naegleria fowleri]KAF0979295.1 hypothetical protein FDP41_001638 [Naegleria fowleri]